MGEVWNRIIMEGKKNQASFNEWDVLYYSSVDVRGTTQMSPSE